MKKIFFIFLCLVFSVSLWAIENPWNNKLPFKEGTVFYKIEGMQKGSSTLYIKDYGKTTAEYRNVTISFFGINRENRSLQLTTPNWIYSIDFGSKQGTKEVNPQKYLIEEFNKLSRSNKKKVIKNVNKLGISLFGNLNGRFEKNVTKILGYRCDKITLNGMDVYTISGTSLMLKTSSNQGGMKFKQIAVKITKGRVPANKFKIPSGIKITHNKEADRRAKLQAKKLIQDLLKGKLSTYTNKPKIPEQPNRANNRNQIKQPTPKEQEQIKKLLELFGGKK